MGPMTKRHAVCLTYWELHNWQLCEMVLPLRKRSKQPPLPTFHEFGASWGQKNIVKNNIKSLLTFQTLGFYWKCWNFIYSKWWHTGHIGANHRLEVRGELGSANVAYCHRIATCGVSNPQIPQMHDEALIIHQIFSSNSGIVGLSKRTSGINHKRDFSRQFSVLKLLFIMRLAQWFSQPQVLTANTHSHQFLRAFGQRAICFLQLAVLFFAHIDPSLSERTFVLPATIFGENRRHGDGPGESKLVTSDLSLPLQHHEKQRSMNL